MDSLNLLIKKEAVRMTIAKTWSFHFKLQGKPKYIG